MQSQTVWLPRLYPSILPVYAAKCPGPKPPKGVGFTDPLSGTLKVDVQYFFDELPTGAKNAKEIKTPILIDMSLAAHGPRLIDAFLKLKTDKLRGAIADLATALVRAG